MFCFTKYWIHGVGIVALFYFVVVECAKIAPDK